MIEAWLAIAVFGVLALLWVILPSRLIRREEGHPLPTKSPAFWEAGDLPRAVIASPTTPSSRDGTPPRGFAGPGRLRRYTAPADGDAPTPHVLYVANLSGMNGWGEVTVPIFRETVAWADVRRKETYRAEVAGAVLEAGNLPALRDLLDGAIRRVMQVRSPHLWLELPSGAAVPVGRHGGGYEARVAAGPVIPARTLALLRERLTSFARSAGMMAEDEEITPVTLGPDLRRDSPLAVLVGPDIWVPVFERHGMLRPEGVGLPEGTSPLPAPVGLLRLAREVGRLLVVPADLWTTIRLARVPPEVWASIARELRPVPRRLRCRRRDGTVVAAPLFAWEDTLVCAYGADPLTVYFALGDWELADRLAADLERAGRIAHRDDVRIERINDREEVTRR